jgi:acetyl-CoA C-acetyltransferase
VVKVAGIGTTTFGKHEARSLKSLLLEACVQALRDADFPRIDAIYVGNFIAGPLCNQEILGAMVASELGLGMIPAAKTEGACASGGIAFRQGYLTIESGEYEHVLVCGVEKMRHAGTDVTTAAINNAMDNDSNEKKAGLTFPAYFGAVAERYFYETGATKEHLAQVALKNRTYALNNPVAQFRKPTTLDEIMQARLITAPLGLFDCSPTTDGACAAVLSRGSDGIVVRASAQASGPTQMQDATDLLTLPAVAASAQRAYARAGLGPDDIDVVELHDCFTITELLAIEALGFFAQGTGWQAVAAGQTQHGGKIPVNTSGGLLSKGHPIGATGLAEIYQVIAQLRGTAVNQVEGARLGLAQNLGGTGAYSVVHIFERGA